ncbi:MAG: hypothetical protein LBL28_08170 [Treponema sp.]|jgi:hypothetical protein|nr:hypothetical protein [Treponema sp.]
MNKHINFEDNIFILNVRIRMIRDTLTLDTDPELFLEKTLEDIDFINNALEALLGNLVENKRLLERDMEFDNLSDLEWQFSRILADFLNSSGNISAAQFPMLKGKIEILRKRSRDRKKIMEDSRNLSEPPLSEPVVSSLELSELLKEF